MAENEGTPKKKLSKKELEMQERMTKGFRKQLDKDYNSMFGVSTQDGYEIVALGRLIPYSNKEAGYTQQPFKVRDDEEMKALVEDIKENGIFNPLIVNRKDDELMILSGHRRAYAARLAGLSEVPCFINEYDDVTAANIVTQSNLLNREKILPSERAFSYKLKMDVLGRQGQRSDLTSPQFEAKLKGVKSSEIIAQDEGVSRAQVERYLQLTKLIPEILEMVDSEKMPLTAGVSISSLPEKAQKIVNDILKETGKSLSINTADKIKNLSDHTKENIQNTITPIKETKEKLPQKPTKAKDTEIKANEREERYIAIPYSEISSHFKKDVSDDEIIDEIIKALSLRWTNN